MELEQFLRMMTFSIRKHHVREGCATENIFPGDKLSHPQAFDKLRRGASLEAATLLCQTQEAQ